MSAFAPYDSIQGQADSIGTPLYGDNQGDPLVAGWPIKSTDHGRGRCFVSFCPWPMNAKPDTLRYPQLGGISGLITLEEVDRLPQWCRKDFAFVKMAPLVMGCYLDCMNLHPCSVRGLKCVIYLSSRVSTSLSAFSALLVGSRL